MTIETQFGFQKCLDLKSSQFGTNEKFKYVFRTKQIILEGIVVALAFRSSNSTHFNDFPSSTACFLEVSTTFIHKKMKIQKSVSGNIDFPVSFNLKIKGIVYSDSQITKIQTLLFTTIERIAICIVELLISVLLAWI